MAAERLLRPEHLVDDLCLRLSDNIDAWAYEVRHSVERMSDEAQAAMILFYGQASFYGQTFEDMIVLSDDQLEAKLREARAAAREILERDWDDVEAITSSIGPAPVRGPRVSRST
jgi:hypothetical protein